jgi:hypothetical protein
MDPPVPTNPPEINFSLSLSAAIEAIKNDPAQLRQLVYELARVHLRRRAWQNNPPIGIWDATLLTRRLEVAIEHVEAFSARQDELRSLQALARLIEGIDRNCQDSAQIEHSGVVVVSPQSSLVPLSLPPRVRVAPMMTARLHSTRRQLWPRMAPLARAVAVGLFLLATFVAADRYYGLLEQKSLPAPEATLPATPYDASAKLLPARQEQHVVDQSSSPAVPLPTVYGVYAISNGALYELEALMGRVPEKVFMSSPINIASHTVVPDGHILFIVFRSDFASNAPDRVTVRAIAKIKRAMSFNAGKPSVTPIEDAWAVRNVAYDFRVAPVAGRSDMLVLQPDQSDFVLTPGRYGLILKGQAYDFTVAGQVSDLAHCLERVEAANGSFYSECKTP